MSGFSGIMFLNLGLVGYISNQTWPYYLALIGKFNLWFYKQNINLGTSAHINWQILTLNINDKKNCWEKFKSNQYLGLLLFFGITFSNLLKNSKKCDIEISNNNKFDG